MYVYQSGDQRTSCPARWSSSCGGGGGVKQLIYIYIYMDI